MKTFANNRKQRQITLIKCDYDLDFLKKLNETTRTMWKLNELNGNVELEVPTIRCAKILTGCVS